jgi:hypothetical protein
MEDFGYQKNYDGEDKFRSIAKQIFLSIAALFSIAAFIYVTVSAYHYVYEDSNAAIKTIKSPEGPIKVIEEEIHDENGAMQIDRKIYEDIFGSKKNLETSGKTKIQDTPQPALPPKPEKQEVTKSTDVKKEQQKIIVFSDVKKEQQQPQEASKDLLTKMEGEKRDNTAAPAKKLSGKKVMVRVQVAAMTSKEAAQDNWKKLNRLYPDLFGDFKPFIEKVDLGKRGIFYRLQVGNFFNQVEAEEFCSRYVAKAQKSRADCIVVE